MNNRQQRYDVVVSGLGPAGLASAYEALKANKTVLVITDRGKDFYRVQNVFIDLPRRAYLSAMLPRESAQDPEDRKFLQNLDSHLGLAIKDIERFLYRRLQGLANDNNLRIVYHSEIQHINMFEGTVMFHRYEQLDSTVPEWETVHFTYLIAADGVQHHALNILTAEHALPAREVPSIYLTHGFPHHHVAAYLTVSRADGQKIELSDKYVLAGAHENYLYALRLNREKYEQETDPTKPLKVNLICETSEALHQLFTRDKTRLLEHCRKVVTLGFAKENTVNGKLIIEPTKPSNKYSEKDKLKCIAFKTNPMQYQRPTYSNHEHYFLQTGDALINPEHRFGTGLILALIQSDLIGSMLQKKITLKDYELECTRIFDGIGKNGSDPRLFSTTNPDPIQSAERIESRARQEQKWLVDPSSRSKCNIM